MPQQSPSDGPEPTGPTLHMLMFSWSSAPSFNSSMQDSVEFDCRQFIMKLRWPPQPSSYQQLKWKENKDTRLEQCWRVCNAVPTAAQQDTSKCLERHMHPS